MTDITIAELRFKETCGACPEQYDVYNEDNEQVGYVRLRWGVLRCDYPDAGGETIVHFCFGEGYKGYFDGDAERMLYLTLIAGAIHSRIQKEEN